MSSPENMSAINGNVSSKSDKRHSRSIGNIPSESIGELLTPRNRIPTRRVNLRRSVSEPVLDSIKVTGLDDIRRNVRALLNLEIPSKSLHIDMLSQLGKEQMRYIEERKIKYNARSMAIRQTMWTAFAYMFILLTVSIAFFIHRGSLTIPEAILFALYTVTTAGFGSVDIPFDTGFLVYVIFFIYLGIAGLTILAALSYQFIAFETSRAKKSQDKDILAVENNCHPKKVNRYILAAVSWVKSSYRKTELGRAIIIFLYLAFLLILLAIGMMKLENWTFVEALYFATFVMTTVGYGDVAPTTRSGTWYVIFVILFNVSFVSIYMGNLARYYLMICDANANRIFHQVKKQHEYDLIKEQTDDEWNDDNYDKKSKRGHRSIKTMNDVLHFVLCNVSCTFSEKDLTDSRDKVLSELVTLQSSWDNKIFRNNEARSPSFVLLLLVQERFANIIATEIAGCQSGIFLKDANISISFDSIEETANKWLVPAGAQDAFRQVAFETILYIGENRLVTLGAESVLNLSPFEVFDIFSPLLAAMADAGTMEGWLARTEELAAVFFPRVDPSAV